MDDCEPIDIIVMEDAAIMNVDWMIYTEMHNKSFLLEKNMLKMSYLIM